MSTIRIDADALFRAVTAAHFKLMVYHLDLDSGEIIARTLRPDEVPDAPQGPSVLPLPKIGGDLTPKKDAAPFGPPPVTASKKLFSDDDLPKKPAFDSGFWKREGKQRPNLFGQGGFRRESGTKKLAEMFGAKQPQKPADPFASPAPAVPRSSPPVDAVARAGCASSPASSPVVRSAGVPPARTGAGETPAVRNTAAPPASAPPAGCASSPAGCASSPAPTRQPRIPVAGEAQQLDWVRAFARDFGDPEIREQIMNALKASKPTASFERVLRKHQRMSQQWDVYFRKQALACAEAWLETLGVQWELVEPERVK